MFPKIRLANKWLITIAVTLGMFMSLMDSTIVNVAVSHLQTTFKADLHLVQWVVTVYMLTQAAVIPTAPYLLARFGSRNAYVGTLVAFLAGSVLCGLAWDIPSLVFFRFVQGIGGGVLLPLVMALLYQTFSPEERGVAVSAMTIPLMIAPAVGPVLGGYLLENFGWQWAFFINIPMGIFSVGLAYKVIPDQATKERPHFDLTGFLTIATGSAAILYGVSTITSEGSTLANALILVAGILFVITFIFIEMFKIRHGHGPLLDLRCFKNPTFAFSNLTNILIVFTRFGILFLIPIYLQTLRQQTAFEAGNEMAIQALATLLVLPIAGRLAKKYGSRRLVLVGLILFATALGLMLLLELNTPIWVIALIFVVSGSAFGLLPQLPVTAMSQIPKEDQKQVAHGSTLISVLQATSAPIGVAVVSGLVQSRSQHYSLELARQGLKGELLSHQSILLAMHNSFLIAFGLIAVAFLIMVLGVPKQTRSSTTEQKQPERPQAATSVSNGNQAQI